VAGPILVTGAQGFVGRHLLPELGARGLPTDVDVTDATALARAMRASALQGVIHLAGKSSVADSWGEVAEVWRVNVLGTVNMLEAVRAEAPEARVLVVSTGQVYGVADQIPTSEESRIAPLSPYAASKAAAELACARAPIDVVVTRSFQHEGPGRDERFAIGSWTAQIARLEEAGGGTIQVGDLTSRRDITDVRDVVRAYVLLLDPSVPRGTYNVASGHAVAMREVLDTLLAMARCPIDVEIDPARSRPTDLPEVCGDAAKLRTATGWTPTIPLEQTLADALEAARQTVAERMASA
jgi:GDP-4-dehydro-6-deoxy-D-mannose reductase